MKFYVQAIEKIYLFVNHGKSIYKYCNPLLMFRQKDNFHKRKDIQKWYVIINTSPKINDF